MLFRNLFGPDEQSIKIFVTVPILDEQSNNDWICEYWMEGLGNLSRRKSFGIDPIQALELALTYLATSIYCSDEFKEGLVTWGHGKDRFDLGLPIADTIKDDVRERIAILGSR
jgi:hypothetical protein